VFIGAMNRVAGRIGEGGEVVVFGQRVATAGEPRPAGSEVEALVRPEALEVLPDAAGPGEVTERTFLGSAVRLRISLDGGQVILVESSSHGAAVPIGSRVGLRVIADRLVVTDPGAQPVAA
jgi:putative spermidine/putrescine transport system ATP-binding protein